MSDSGAPDLQSHNESQSTPASSVTSVGHDSQDSRLRLVDIEKMRSDLLQLLDQYDAIALRLRRVHIPLRRSWESTQAVADAHLQEMVDCHKRARAEQLRLDVGESTDSTLSVAKVRVLYKEVASLAAVLSSGMETLKTCIAEMVAAADAAVAAVPGLPHALYPGSARSADSADSALDSAARHDERRTSRSKELERNFVKQKRRRSLERERNSNAALRMAALNPVAPGHSEEDCMATAPDYSDWKLTARLIDELIPIVGNRQGKNLQFVEWSIRYMARKGEQLPYANGISFLPSFPVGSAQRVARSSS